MMKISIKEIAACCGGRFYGAPAVIESQISSITTDSRKVEPGCLFIAIKGQRVDGHDYIDEVYQNGTVCCITEKELQGVEKPYILVESTLQAVKDIGEYYRSSLNIPVVGITGSVGKTSTKEAIASVLKEKYCTLKTKGNFNNELGLPFTIFRLRADHEAAVLEMGISDFGEMHRLSKIAKPDICVITNIGDCHLENLIDRPGVLRAKSEIFDFMNPEGTVILNGDDEQLASVKEVHGKCPVYFGLKPEYDYYADNIENMGLAGTRCVVHTPKDCFSVTIYIPGSHMVYNILAATAAGEQMHMDKEQIIAGIESLQPVGGRNNIIQNGTLTIIDDCYNANPISMKASLEVLSKAEGRKVAILGDMFELGENALAMHGEVGEHAVASNIDSIVCVGSQSLSMYQSAVNKKNTLLNRGEEKAAGIKVQYLETLEDLRNNLKNIINSGDTILVKASHGMHFEKIVAELEKLK